MTRPTSCRQPRPTRLRGEGGRATAVCALLLDSVGCFNVDRKGRDEQRSVARHAVDGDFSVERLGAVLQADEARASTRIDSADAVVANSQADRSVLLADI